MATFEDASPGRLADLFSSLAHRSNEARWKATLSSYDLDNNIAQRIDDREEDDAGNQLKAGRQNDYTYDGTDRLTQQIDQGKDTQASTSDDTRITTSYFPQGWEQQRITDKYVPGTGWQPKKTQDWTYYDNGQLKTMSTKNGDGTVLESHDLTYIDSATNQYVNGNQTKDVFKRSGPAASCSSVTCIATYQYDARDRLIHQENGAGGTSDYTLNPAGNIVHEVQSDSGTTDYSYQGPRLDTATFAGDTTRYHYDSHGNLDCITGEAGTDADCATGNGVRRNYSYDLLDRMTGYKDTDLGGNNASYEYDALDRQTRQQEQHGTAADRITNLSYLGLTDKVTKEEQSGDDGTVNRTKEYSFDAYGSANGMTDTVTGQPSKSYSYGKDPLGSVSQLIDDSGKAAAAYGYKPYGDTDKSLSGGDPSPTNPINPVRFTEKRLDTGSGTIDTGSRRFGPSNRFLQEDRYADALSDLDLSTDPLTANRYSLAGGNPANFVEVDGHFSIGGLIGDAKDAVSDAAGSVGDAVGDAAHAVGDAATAVGKFAWDNKVAIASTVAGLGCGVVTAGLAAAGCAAGVGAVGGALEARSQCKGEGFGCYAKHAAVGAALNVVPGGAAKLTEKATARVAEGQLGKAGVDAAEGGAVKESAGVETAAGSCKNSFIAGTPVLMADGSQKPIEQVHQGDWVLATDPDTGVTSAETVVTPIQHGGVHAMVRVALSDGSSITATDKHPFWDETQRAFVNARDLRTGDKVLTSSGRHLVVRAIAVFIAVLVAFNLQIDQIHTYYAGATPVLVHNSCEDVDKLSAAGKAEDKNGRTRAGYEYQKHMGRGELPKVPGKQLDEAGQNLLDDILTHPESRFESPRTGNFDDGRRVIHPSGIGATFDRDGALMYFGRHRAR